MDQTKITLSEKELQLVVNSDWILTKNRIIQKVKQLLERLQQQQADLLDSCRDQLPVEIFSISPKISKGENYKGLPYLILDQPRFFDQANAFAIRTMFWWGNFFSVTLHLSGRFKQEFEPKLARAYPLLTDTDSYYCIQSDPWDHDFEKTNYQPVKMIDAEKFGNDLIGRPFIKIASHWKLENWDKMEASLYRYYKNLIGILVK